MSENDVYRNLEFRVRAVATVRNSRLEPTDDSWERVRSRIVLEPHVPVSSLAGLESFSHVEVIYLFHQQSKDDVVMGAEHPRENVVWPKVGIFAQRKKSRPNRLGLATARIERVDLTERTLHVSRLDAINETPVLDIKPVMREFLATGEMRQPDWSHELMRDYW